MTKPICCALNCKEISWAKGLCSHHYYKAKLKDPKRPRCKIKECQSPALTKGCCGKHRIRLFRHGTEILEKSLPRSCLVAGCKAVFYGKEMCFKHYQRIRRKGTIKVSYERGAGESVTKARLRQKKYRIRNSKKVAKISRRYQKRLRLATPKWVPKEELAFIYDNCPEGYEVDHIEPLKGKNSSGLHVPWNLQYLPRKENGSKGNRQSELGWKLADLYR